MPAWTNITNALVAVGAKPFATTIQALRDNPAAIAEGQPGAPRVLGKALGSTFLSYQSATVANPVTFTGLAGMETIRLDIALEGWSTGATLQARFSSDNGSTYGSYQAIVTNAASASTQTSSGAVHINLRTGAAAVLTSTQPLTAGSTTLTVPSGCNAFQLRMSAAGGSGTIRALGWCLGGLEV